MVLRVAALLGKTMREVEAMDADEFLWWEAFYSIDPFGTQREDMRFAMLAQVVAAIISKNTPKLESFMLFPERRMRRQTPEEQARELQKVTEFLSGNGNASR